MSSKEILSPSLAGKNECELCEKSFAYHHDLLRHQHTIHRERLFQCPLCSYRTARKDKLVSHQKVHTKTSSDQALNRERKNKTKTQLSSDKIDLTKETLQLFNLKRKIPQQDQLRLPNIHDQKTLLIQMIRNNF